jgi:hypothetical protein
MNEKLKIVVYDKVDDDIDGLFLSDEHFYASYRGTCSAFDNWYSDDVTYDFDRWYGENNWSVDSPDDDTQVLYVDDIPKTVVKLVHIYGTHVLE